MVCFSIDPHPFASLLLLLFFSTIFSNTIFFQIPLYQSVLALSPLSAFSSHSIPHLISSTLSSLHHIHNRRLMAASAVPHSNNTVTPDWSHTNLQQADQVCLCTDCKLFHI